MGTFDFSNREQVTARLKELNEADIPVMTLEKLLSKSRFSYLKEYVDKATAEEIDTANEYFSLFCEAGYNDNKDIFTNEECIFTWGLTHGELIATHGNGLDRIGLHYLVLAGTRHKIEITLQYHPSCYAISLEEE